MYQGQRIGAVILMGGTGSRFGGDLPKQFIPLGDKKVYQHTLNVFLETGIYDEIVLVCHPDFLSITASEVSFATVIAGGSSRQESSYLGLLGFSKRPDIVSIHDAVRPFVSKETLIENVRLSILHGAVDTCIATADTLVYAPNQETIEKIPKREHYLRGQTPQTFRYEPILNAHESARKSRITESSDDCQLILNQGFPVYIAKGSERNFKITTDFDLKLALLLLLIK